MEQLYPILGAVLGGGLMVAVLQRVFSSVDRKRTEQASIFTAQITDGDNIRKSQIDRIDSLQCAVERLIKEREERLENEKATAIENAQLRTRLKELETDLIEFKLEHKNLILEQKAFREKYEQLVEELKAKEREISILRTEVIKLKEILNRHEIRIDN